MSHALRHKLGAIAYDLPRFAWAMRPVRSKSANAAPWAYFCNRNERLLVDPNRQGVTCDWQWTSDLHIAKVFPPLGLYLMRRALRDWPIRLRPMPDHQPDRTRISFIIGHRGLARLPHLLLTLQGIAAQRQAAFECIVVEQSATPEIQSELPGWVRYVHTPVPYSDMPYCRSWAFNVGAQIARGTLLVLHDNDIFVPQDYATQLMARYEEGYEVINLKRFIFYLTEAHTGRILSTGQLRLDEPPEAVMQNALAGGSLAIARPVYFAIGGFDEAFIGWGGEDNEFWERALTRNVWPYGYLPLVHLWHAAQTEKLHQSRETAKLYETRSAIPALQRIVELSGRDAGNLTHLIPPYAPAEARGSDVSVAASQFDRSYCESNVRH